MRSRKYHRRTRLPKIPHKDSKLTQCKFWQKRLEKKKHPDRNARSRDARNAGRWRGAVRSRSCLHYGGARKEENEAWLLSSQDGCGHGRPSKSLMPLEDLDDLGVTGISH
jgi:hypothetical protein